MQENYAKISKIKQLEAIGARWATMGHLVASPGPTMAPPSVVQPMVFKWQLQLISCFKGPFFTP